MLQRGSPSLPARPPPRLRAITGSFAAALERRNPFTSRALCLPPSCRAPSPRRARQAGPLRLHSSRTQPEAPDVPPPTHPFSRVHVSVPGSRHPPSSPAPAPSESPPRRSKTDTPHAARSRSTAPPTSPRIPPPPRTPTVSLSPVPSSRAPPPSPGTPSPQAVPPRP